MNTISAGMLATPGMQKYLARTPGAEEAIKAMIPFNRLGCRGRLRAATLPEIAVSNGAKLILINLSPTFIDPRADVLLRANVAEVLPLLVETQH